MLEKFSLNRKGTDYFVGDLHGMYDAFMAALAAVDFDFETDRVFSVGDLIDRGPDSLKCLQLLEKPWFHAVLGNHEDMMIGGQSYSVWMMNGGEWINDIAPTEQARLRALINQNMPIKLQVQTRLGTVGVVHADAIGTWEGIGGQNAIWGRKRYYSKDCSTVSGIDLVAVGHTPLKTPITMGNVVYLDTGAVFESEGGYITLLSTSQLFEQRWDLIEAKPVVNEDCNPSVDG